MPLAAQARDSTRHAALRIIGVFDARTGEPLDGVQVIDALSGTYATTTPTGTARLDFIVFRGAGALIELRKLGYEARQVVVSGTDTASVTETLERLTELAPVVTSERYRVDLDPGLRAGFETRCQSKAATCFRDEDLLKKQNGNLADLLVRAEGVMLTPCGDRGKGSGRVTAKCGGIAMHPVASPPRYCTPTYFINGIVWNPIMESAVDVVPGMPAMAPFTPENVKSIEVYAPERVRPLRFEGDPTCGAVVLWTK
jgi:hypothetical protein